MTILEWDKSGERRFETGVDRGVLFVQNKTGGYTSGVAWNGLTGVTLSPSGAESNKQYADNQVYLNMISAEEVAATIEAFHSPIEFDACDGSVSVVPGLNVGQQRRVPFGFSWRTRIGNDIVGDALGHKLHLLWNAQAGVSEKPYTTTNESPEAMTLSWEVSTTPVTLTTKVDDVLLRPTSYLSFSSTELEPTLWTKLTDLIYGTEDNVSSLPSPDEIIALMQGGELPEGEGSGG